MDKTSSSSKWSAPYAPSGHLREPDMVASAAAWKPDSPTRLAAGLSSSTLVSRVVCLLNGSAPLPRWGLGVPYARVSAY